MHALSKNLKCFKLQCGYQNILKSDRKIGCLANSIVKKLKKILDG